MPLQARAFLTEAEQKVLQFVADGHTNAEIATTLSLSPNTVHTHVAHILDKLEVRSRHSAGRIYRTLTALPPDLALTLEQGDAAPVEECEVEMLLRRLGVRDITEARKLYRSVVSRAG